MGDDYDGDQYRTRLAGAPDYDAMDPQAQEVNDAVEEMGLQDPEP
jgi:hypothetical protein